MVVCTLGRPEQLADCLTSLAGLRTRPHELIVVDNDPSDPRSAAVAARFGARVVAEPRRGLSAARNAGIRAARSPVVAFLDDDCRVEPGWLDDLAAEFADPLVAAVVGYVGAGELETDAQWLFEAQGGFERRHRPEVRDGAVAGGWGAAGFGDGNVFFRRELFERIGGYAEALGPGTPARSAQDADMLYRLMETGLRVRYSPSRVAWHRHRRELEPLAATLEGYMTGLSAHAAVTLARRRDPAALRLWWWFARRYFPRLARDLIRSDLDRGRARLLAVQTRGIALGAWRGRGALKDLAAPAIEPAAAPARGAARDARRRAADGLGGARLARPQGPARDHPARARRPGVPGRADGGRARARRRHRRQRGGRPRASRPRGRCGSRSSRARASRSPATAASRSPATTCW